MTPELRTVKRAANRRRTTADEYRAAVVAARHAGHTLAEIGAAADVTKQRVSAMLARYNQPEGG